MKKTFRLGVFLTIIGITLLLVTVFRGISTGQGGQSSWSIQPVSWSFPVEEFWLPRSLRIQVSADSAVDIFILNENGITLWRQERKLSPIYAFNNTRHAIYTVNIDRRGVYAFLIHNPSNSDIEVEMSTTVYGFEQDLQWASIIIIAVGAITTVAQKLIIPWFAHKNES